MEKIEEEKEKYISCKKVLELGYLLNLDLSVSPTYFNRKKVFFKIILIIRKFLFAKDSFNYLELVSILFIIYKLLLQNLD